VFRKLVSFDEAKRIISNNVKTEPLGLEEVRLLDACGRVLGVDAVSGLNVPPFDRSAVDGYAVVAEQTFEADESKPVTLQICGCVNIGELPLVCVEPCTAAEIVTGAPIPDGADAVVMVEDTEKKDGVVQIFSTVARGENVMRAGSDIKSGSRVLLKGTLLGAREIGVLAAIGLAKVRVYIQPRVAVLSTGGEVAEPGEKLAVGKIYDINAYSLCAAVLECGGNPVYLGVVPDDRAKLESSLRRGLSIADVVVTSGGVSVGPKDVMPQTVDSLGPPGVVVSGVAIKPGKPVTVAVVGGKPVFCFPGHPTSALLVFHLLARPIIGDLAGRRVGENPVVSAVAGVRLFPARGRRTFVMVKLKKNESRKLVATPLETGQSGAITTLANSDGFVEIDENQQFVDAGEEINVHLFKNACWANHFHKCIA
jgi:putative molybdopterin biosynthesis protein